MSFEITASDLSALALGSGLLACGGGGNPYYGRLAAQRLIAERRPVKVIDLDEMEPNAVAVMAAIIGAPLVLLEKPPSESALNAGFEAVQQRLGGKAIGAFVAVEIGGVQSMLPLMLAAATGRPLLNGDGMGRAFPEAQMCTFLIYGMEPGTPAALSDDHGLLWWAPRLPFVRFGGTGRFGRIVGVGLERAFRRYCVRKGGIIYATATLSQDCLGRTLVPGSVKLSLDIGRRVLWAREHSQDPTAAILEATNGQLLFRGKVVDVERSFRAGHDLGGLVIEGLEGDQDRMARVEFKNEYLVVWVDGEVVLTVPELITIIETETGEPVTTDLARIGLRVSILGISSSPLLRTREALRVVGPRAFGYRLTPVELS